MCWCRAAPHHLPDPPVPLGKSRERLLLAINVKLEGWLHSQAASLGALNLLLLSASAENQANACINNCAGKEAEHQCERAALPASERGWPQPSEHSCPHRSHVAAITAHSISQALHGKNNICTPQESNSLPPTQPGHSVPHLLASLFFFFRVVCRVCWGCTTARSDCRRVKVRFPPALAGNNTVTVAWL